MVFIYNTVLINLAPFIIASECSKICSKIGTKNPKNGIMAFRPCSIVSMPNFLIAILTNTLMIFVIIIILEFFCLPVF